MQSLTLYVDGEDVLAVQDGRYPGKTFEVRPQPSNIDACVSFSALRCVLSIISIALVLTDIPRTGLFINLASYYPKVGPDATMYYGPYAYPVVHFNTTSGDDAPSSVAGYAGDTRIDALDLWAYKFDSLSIPTRALAEHLNVSSYPPCLLYSKHCPRSTLAVETVFNMVNGLLTAIETRYFTQDALRQLPLVFLTTNYWSDRLHHILLGTFGYRVDVRVHAVYHFTMNRTRTDEATAGINICEHDHAAEAHHPVVCKAPIAWMCDHPFIGANLQIPLAESVRLRVAALQRDYPDASIDLTMITTRSELRSQQNLILPTAYYSSDNTEITTLIRGRDCRSGVSCTTVFLDDYRYERAILEESSGSLRVFTSSLRAVSQGYVWLRVILLVFICYRSRATETQHRDASPQGKLQMVLLTLLKIPSHVIVYGSWLPIIGYSVAHVADCGIVHLVSENFWSTTNGILSFDFMKYVVVASVQMRNIWLIALAWKCSITMYNRYCTNRSDCWQPQNGLAAFRGMFIGATSFLTIFSFLRALRFRDSRVLSFVELQRNSGERNAFFTQRLAAGVPDFGYPLDVKATAIATGIVVGYVHLARAVSRISKKSTTSSFFCQTFYVPLSTGVLFPTSALNAFWYTELTQPPEAQRSSPNARRFTSFTQFREMSSRVLSSVLPSLVGPQRRTCDVCDFVSTPLHWRAIQGCQRHETLFGIGRRSIETQSMVRLTHIGVLSDPIVFFKLRVLGKQLYLYQVKDRDQVSPFVSAPASSVTNAEDCVPIAMISGNANRVEAFLSPVCLPQKGGDRAFGHPYINYEFVGRVSSARVPWGLLVDCG